MSKTKTKTERQERDERWGIDRHGERLVLLPGHEADDGGSTLVRQPPLLQQLALCLVDLVQLLSHTAPYQGLRLLQRLLSPLRTGESGQKIKYGLNLLLIGTYKVLQRRPFLTIGSNCVQFSMRVCMRMKRC